MNQSSKITAVAVGAFSLIAIGFAGAASGNVERDVAPKPAAQLTASQRIDAAFAAAAGAEHSVQPEAAKGSPKGDLLVKAGCSGQYWPHIEAGCLVVSDGRGAPPVRTVTVGYQVGESHSVLIRIPAPQVAAR